MVVNHSEECNGKDGVIMPTESKEQYIMSLQEMAETVVKATETYIEFFGYKPDMTDVDDVKELLSIHSDVICEMERNS